MRYLKSIAIYLLILSFGAFIFTFLLSYSITPEKTIAGEWEEMEWEYEKVNKVGDSVILNSTNTSNLKELLGKELIIHEAENWIFSENGELVLKEGENSKIVSWRIKGRGHVLKIKYNNDTIEYYNITKLTDDELVLNFDSNIQARGIAKLTFRKISNI
jgi:sporulation protein YlmC with PRC-barrel domain